MSGEISAKRAKMEKTAAFAALKAHFDKEQVNTRACFASDPKRFEKMRYGAACVRVCVCVWGGVCVFGSRAE